MSVVGTLASVAGGLFMGLSFALLGALFASSGDNGDETPLALLLHQLGPLLVLGAFGGFVGSLLDSAMGQLLQVKCWGVLSVCV